MTILVYAINYSSNWLHVYRHVYGRKRNMHTFLVQTVWSHSFLSLAGVLWEVQSSCFKWKHFFLDICTICLNIVTWKRSYLLTSVLLSTLRSQWLSWEKQWHQVKCTGACLMNHDIKITVSLYMLVKFIAWYFIWTQLRFILESPV